jgi:Arm domain-containing DNA-binding protein
MKLTDAIVEQLPTPAKGNRIYYEERGFGIRITCAGARSFIVNYVVRGSGQERRFTIGQFPDWSTCAARAKAQKLRRDISNGGDPLADIARCRQNTSAPPPRSYGTKVHLWKAAYDALRELGINIDEEANGIH